MCTDLKSPYLANSERVAECEPNKNAKKSASYECAGKSIGDQWVCRQMNLDGEANVDLVSKANNIVAWHGRLLFKKAIVIL